jgi:hypothetical protein
MSKAAWYWEGDSSVINNPFRALGSFPSHYSLPPALGCAGCDSFSSSHGMIMERKNKSNSRSHTKEYSNSESASVD